jgi:hypothetical protein
MSDIESMYKVVRKLSTHMSSDAIRITLLFLERNLWEYPEIQCGGNPNSVGYESWEEYINHGNHCVYFWSWDDTSYFFENQDDEDENEGDDCPRDVLTLSVGHCDIHVKVEQSQQDEIKQFLKSRRQFIPSSLDIESFAK